METSAHALGIWLLSVVLCRSSKARGGLAGRFGAICRRVVVPERPPVGRCSLGRDDGKMGGLTEIIFLVMTVVSADHERPRLDYRVSLGATTIFDSVALTGWSVARTSQVKKTALLG